MSAQLSQLKRLHHLRAAKERMCEVELVRARHSVAEIEATIRATRASGQRARQEGRDGLLEGEWERWWIGESVDGLSERAAAALRPVLEKRRQHSADVQSALAMASREAERVALLRALIQERMRMEETRVAQAVSDDRFAARAHWTRTVRARRQDL